MLFSPGWRAPIGQRGVLAVFTAGLVLGGIASGAVLWLLSGLTRPLPPYAGAGTAVGFAVLGFLREAGLVRVPLPENARQVPADTLRRGPRRGAFQFGFELGTGVRTYLPSSVPHVVALALLLGHQPAAAFLAAGTGFGLGRAATAALSYASHDAGWERRLVARLRWITKGVSGAVLIVLAVLLLGPYLRG